MASRLLLIALLVGAVLSVSSPASAAPRSTGGWPKVSHLHDGSTVTAFRNGRVVVRASGGRVTSDSSFGSYHRYLEWVSFMTTFRNELLAGNRNGVSWLMAWPWLWNHGGTSTQIDLRTSFFAHYHAVFTSAVLGAVRAADPRALFCKDESEVMLGSGVVWGELEPHGLLAIISINTPSA